MKKFYPILCLVILLSLFGEGTKAASAQFYHYRTPAYAVLLSEVPITDSYLDTPTIDKRVVMTLELGDLKAGDIVQVHASQGFSNGVDYLIVIGTQIILADNINDISGLVNVGGVQTQNVDHYLTHHISFPMSGSIELQQDVYGARINYIAYAVSGLKYSDAGGGIPVFTPGTLPTEQEFYSYPVAAPGHPNWADFTTQYRGRNNTLDVDTGTGFISATIIRQ